MTKVKYTSITVRIKNINKSTTILKKEKERKEHYNNKKKRGKERERGIPNPEIPYNSFPKTKTKI